jgi:hypothetical protein
VDATSEGKSDDSKENFYEELEQDFDHFPKYHMKILLGDFSAKVCRENITKPTIGNSNDNGVRIVNFATLKIWLLRASYSRTETFTSTAAPIMLGRLTTRRSCIDRQEMVFGYTTCTKLQGSWM